MKYRIFKHTFELSDLDANNKPHCATRHIATVRTPADYVWHLFGETAGLKFEEAGL